MALRWMGGRWVEESGLGIVATAKTRRPCGCGHATGFLRAEAVPASTKRTVEADTSEGRATQDALAAAARDGTAVDGEPEPVSSLGEGPREDQFGLFGRSRSDPRREALRAAAAEREREAERQLETEQGAAEGLFRARGDRSVVRATVTRVGTR